MKIKTNLKKASVIKGKTGSDPELKLEFSTSLNDKINAEQLHDLMCSIVGHDVDLNLKVNSQQPEMFPANEKVARAK